jgi:predicted KAP-like P-loop ATPase
MIKKVMSLLITLCLFLTLLSSISVNAENDVELNNIYEMVSYITEIQEFTIWKNADIKFDSELYDLNGTKSKLLFSLVNKI